MPVAFIARRGLTCKAYFVTMISPDVKQKIARLADSDPWTWIVVLYATQVLGAVLGAVALGLGSEQMVVPIGLLITGTLHAVVALSGSRAASSKVPHRRLPAIIYGLFIFSLSNESFEQVDAPFNFNVFHPLEYAVLAIFFCWMRDPVLISKGSPPLVLRVLAGGVAFAVLDEIHQSFIPGRMPSLVDVLLDGVGLSIGCALFFSGRLLRRTFAQEGLHERLER